MKSYDCIIIGGGIAGLSSSIYLRRKNISTLIITLDIGGRTNIPEYIENYPGYKKIEGYKIPLICKEQAEELGAEFSYEKVNEIKKEIDLPLVSETAKEKEKIIVISKKENYDIIDALRLVAPGMQLREAMEDIVRARKGALIVLESNPLLDVIEGGLKLNCKFTPQRLFELSKMDGAVVLSGDLRKIIYANCLLAPSPLIPTNETGTRHKAAERTARQTKTLVIAISERRNTITLYYYNLKYSLRKTEEILNRAMEKLQVLDKQREIYNHLLESLDTFEVTGLASTSNVAAVLQRIEIILRISETIKRDIIELGNEGNLVKIRFKELVKGVEKENKQIIRDYLDSNRYYKEISKINFDGLLDLQKVLEIIFGKKEEEIMTV